MQTIYSSSSISSWPFDIIVARLAQPVKCGYLQLMSWCCCLRIIQTSRISGSYIDLETLRCTMKATPEEVTLMSSMKILNSLWIENFVCLMGSGLISTLTIQTSPFAQAI